MRAFIAVNPGPEVQTRLHDALGAVRDLSLPVRWVPPENIHVTLKFLGDVPDDRAPELASETEGAVTGFEPFEVLATGFGAFPSLARPRVLWVGIDDGTTLTRLQAEVERAMARLGFEPEDRDFHPHLTVGRTRRKPSGSSLKRLGETVERLDLSESFRVESVDLMRSELRPDGARYDVAHSVPLSG